SGYAVALVSGGDPGLFGLAPLALSMAGDLKVKVLPGITAAQAAAKAIGAPYSNGIALLSLSDYLQPWDAVVRAMEGAESGDITVALYNPVKRDLPDKLADVRRIFSKRRLVLVRDAGRDDESVRELPVSELDQNAIDMRTLMIFLSPAVRETQSPDGRKIWLETRGYGAEIDAVTTPNLGQFLVLGGTSEGRLVASKLLETGFSVTVSVARDAGLATVPDGAASLVGARDAEGWISVLAANSSELYGVIDATHPFASGATEAIKAACDVSGTPLCRFERPESVVEGSIDVQSPEEAVSKAIELTGAEDVVFLSIGVNLIPRVLPALRSAGRGVLARMLPTVDSMRAAERAGLEPCEIIASWGPGGADLNEALCVDRAVKCVISKESGEAGGVQSKALAAQKLGLPLILIRRPSEPEGLNRTDDPNALLEWCGELAIRRGL
ncbi:MAG: precorrin-6A reductase, partial [Synergistaceae bacterium]|nr:precorrin-6A reductase [Synergistaceae bacterium]